MIHHRIIFTFAATALLSSVLALIAIMIIAVLQLSAPCAVMDITGQDYGGLCQQHIKRTEKNLEVGNENHRIHDHR